MNYILPLEGVLNMAQIIENHIKECRFFLIYKKKWNVQIKFIKFVLKKLWKTTPLYIFTLLKATE